MTIKERYAAVLRYFEESGLEAETELLYRNPFELLVAVVLSAQCTDKRVNIVSQSLFARLPDAASMAAAGEDVIRGLIASISYPNAKARHLAGLAQLLMERFGGEVPSAREDLMALPGVGRKTANVILSVLHGEAAMAVDTHVFRVSARLGLTRGAKTPLATEVQLMRHIPEALVPKAHHWLILHGRRVCVARNPRCGDCGLQACCAYFRRNS
ncbi:MAG: endonuclease III, partial [Sphingomonadales bacterium]|nr:endonuclease III [Sphingomonadales bacterium]